MYPSYRTTAARRRKKLLFAGTVAFVLFASGIWIATTYAIFHLFVKYW